MAFHKYELKINKAGEDERVLYFPTKGSALKHIGKILSKRGAENDEWGIRSSLYLYGQGKDGTYYELRRLFEKWEFV